MSSKKSTRGRVGSLPVSMRNATKEKELAKAVSNLRKARDEELEELRRNRATNSNPFFKLKHSDGVDGNATVDSNSTPCSEPQSASQKRAASDFASLNSSDTFHSNIKRLSTTKSTTSQNSYAFSLDQFYKEQRKKAYIDKKKKSEAAQRLRTYSSSIYDQSMISARISLSNAQKFENAMTNKFNRNGSRMLKAITDFFANSDFRAFVFVTHEKFGMLLLHCTKKKNKGPHFQLPGGHIDPSEFVAASKISGGDPRRQLILAAKNAAARELCEETGIDVSHNLKRLAPAILRFDFECNNELNCEYRNRLFFYLDVDDSDFSTPDDQDGAKLYSSLDEKASDIVLKLSSEHSGFKFQKDFNVAVEELEKHSEGACSEALQMAIKQKTRKMPDRNTIQAIIKAIEDDNKTKADKEDIPTRNGKYKYNAKNGNASQQENISIINNIEAISLLRSPESKPKDLIGFTIPHLPESDDSRNSLDHLNSTASEISAVTYSVNAPHSPLSQNVSYAGEIESLETDEVYHPGSEDSITEASTLKKQRNSPINSPLNAHTPGSNTKVENKSNETILHKNSSNRSLDENKDLQSLVENIETLKLNSVSLDHTNDNFEKNMYAKSNAKNIPFIPNVSNEKSISDESKGSTNETLLLPLDEKNIVNSAHEPTLPLDCSNNETLLEDNLNRSCEPSTLLCTPISSNPSQERAISSDKVPVENKKQKSSLNESITTNLKALISDQKDVLDETSHMHANEPNQVALHAGNSPVENTLSPNETKATDIKSNEQNKLAMNLNDKQQNNSTLLPTLHEKCPEKDLSVQSLDEVDIYSSDEDEDEQNPNILQAFACTFCWQKPSPIKEHSK